MEADNLDKKIFGAIGRYKKHHMSSIDTARSQILITEPGRRGFFSIDKMQPGKIYDVYCDGGCIGRMNTETILAKFGRL